MMPRVDLNADVGEGFGARHHGDEEQIFRHVTSANVACGFHAGDPATIAATISAAKARKLAIGAHPSYPDASGFGRQSVDLPLDELQQVIVYQIGAIDAIARTLGVQLAHVKPHGALYNDAAANAALAAAVAQAVASYNKELILVGLAGSHSLAAGKAEGLRIAAEAFCDRVYESDGRLRARSQAGALIEDPLHAARQAVEIVREGTATAYGGRKVRITAQTLCIHGDTRGAVDTAAAVRHALTSAGVEIVKMQELV